MVDINLAQAIVNGLMLGGIYMALAVGLNVIFGVVKIVNFAQGEFLMLSMYSVYWLYALIYLDPIISIILNIPISIFVGWVTFKYLVKDVVEKGDYVHIALTLGVSFMFIGLAQIFWKPIYRGIPTKYATWAISLGGVNIGVTQLLILLYGLFSAIILSIFFRWTDTGRAMRAVSQDVMASMLMGVNITKMYTLAWIIGILVTSLAGNFLATFYYIHPNVGQDIFLYAWFVVVFGGLGSHIGAVIGSIILGIVQSVATMYISADLSLVIVFLVFILLLLFRPEGLLGREVRK